MFNKKMELIIKDIEISKVCWRKKRWKYNIGLIIAGFTAFILYVILSELLIAPYDHEYEISGFTVFTQGIAYLIMMSIANLFYNLGYYFDKRYNNNHNDAYRKKLFNLGFWFSVSLPFLIPVLVVVRYFIQFA